MVVIWFLGVVFFLLVQFSSGIEENVIEEIGLSTIEIIKKLGYPVEVHTIQTKDGYLLDVHRIPRGKNKKSLKNTSPVLIYAGLFTDSSSFISSGPNRSLGFVLADLGYDVWLGNVRGTTHCRKHITLDPYKNKKQFWDFSFQEMADYDVPATIDYILQKTNKEDLNYIGYSQGTTTAFAMLAEKLIYNKKIRLLIIIAPILDLEGNQKPFLKMVLKENDYFWPLINEYQLYDTFPLTDETKRITIPYCSYNSTTQYACMFILCRILYASCEQIDKVRLPVFLSNLPAGGSFKQMQHYVQLRHGKFQKYDYGKNKNLKLYESEMPPVYNLSNTKVPTAIFYSTEDTLASYKVVELLTEKLPNIIYIKKIPKFNHIDLLLGIDLHKFVNADIANLLKYNRQYQTIN